MSTIAGIATPQAASGIGIIRISGTDALKIADKVFRNISGKPLCKQGGYTALFGHVYDGETVLDEAVALVFLAPKSYTGEDTVEFSCHGGAYILERVLRAVFTAGASPAQPGEFTKRAFLNGKRDLAEAEAVMSLISASGEEARAATLGVLSGTLSTEINACRDILAKTSAQFAAWVDYPDDEIPELGRDELSGTLGGIKSRLEKLLSGFDSGKAVIEGVETAIVGRPNVGKSTLLNALSGQERAIVTDIPGTTRDVLTESVRLGNVLLRLSDTAGIRTGTLDAVEKVGIERSKEQIERASLVLMVFDCARELSGDDRELIRLCLGQRLIAVLNKTDCAERLLTKEMLHKAFSDSGIEISGNIVEISAAEKSGLSQLTAAVENILGTAAFDPSLPTLTSERQRDCVRRAAEALDEAVSALESGMTEDAVNVSADAAIEALNALTGETASETVVNEVFKNFCVGK